MKRRPALYQMLEDLVNFPTVASNVKAQNDCLDYAQSRLENTGLHTMRYTSKGVPSLVAGSQPGKQPKLLLQAHLDVVPANPTLFRLQKQNGRLIGRGAYDMKFAAACFLAAAKALSERNKDLDYAIMLTCDEEVGGRNGVKYLLEQAGYSGDICLLPDGGDDWAIEETAKGAWFVQVRASGVSAHGSRPWEGDNAAHKLMDFMQAARQSFQSTTPAEQTVVISQLRASDTFNQVPGQAVGMLDVRFPNRVAHQIIASELVRLADVHEVTLTSYDFSNTSELNVNLPQVKTWKQIVRQATGRRQIKHCLSHGSSDARYFTAVGIPTIVTRPKGGCAHGSEEWIDEDDLYAFYDCIVEFIQQVALADKPPK